MKELIKRLYDHTAKFAYVDLLMCTELSQKRCKEVSEFVNSVFTESYYFDIKSSDKYNFSIQLTLVTTNTSIKIELFRMLKKVFILSLQIDSDKCTMYVSKNDNYLDALIQLYNECISKKSEVS